MNTKRTSRKSVTPPAPFPLLQCPTEILSLIFDPIDVDKAELLDQGPLCSELKPFYDAQLFYDVDLSSIDNFKSLYKMLWQKSEKGRQEIGSLVRVFTLSCGEYEPTESGKTMENYHRLRALLKNLKSISLDNNLMSHAVLDNLGQYQTLKSMKLYLDVSDAVPVYKLLEPFKKLSNLKSLDLTLDFSELESNPEDIRGSKLPSQLRAIEIIGLENVAFSNSYFLKFARRLPPLESLHIDLLESIDDDSCELTEFLSQLDSSNLETFSLISSEGNFEQSQDTIDDFLVEATNLKSLTLGVPVLSDLSEIKFTKLERLVLELGAGVSYDDLLSFIEGYPAVESEEEDEEGEEEEEEEEKEEFRKPLQLELNGVEVGYSGDGFTWELLTHDLVSNRKHLPDFGAAMEVLDEQDWSLSHWNQGYHLGQANELGFAADRNSKIEIVGEAAEALASDHQYLETASTLHMMMEGLYKKWNGLKMDQFEKEMTEGFFEFDEFDDY